MSLIQDPEGRASKVTTKLQAARLHLELESELALVDEDDLPAGWEDKAERALKDLEGRYGGADELRDVDTSNPSKASARPWTPSLSGAAKRGLGTGQADTPDAPPAASGDASRSSTERVPSSRQRAEGRQRSATRRAGGGTRRRRPTPSRGRGRGRVQRAWRQTGVPGQAQSISLLALQVIGVTIGLSAAYLLLANATGARRGGSIAELLSNGLQTAIHVVVEPVDPLNPPRVTKSGQVAIDNGLLRDGSPLATGTVTQAGPTSPLPTGPRSNRPPLGAKQP